MLHTEPAILGDVQLAGQTVFEYQIPARTQSGFQGPGQSQSLLSEGLRTLAQVPVSPEPWHSALHALRLVPGRGQRPQYGLRPESERRTARAGSSGAAAPRMDDNLFHGSYA